MSKEFIRVGVASALLLAMSGVLVAGEDPDMAPMSPPAALKGTHAGVQAGEPPLTGAPSSGLARPVAGSAGFDSVSARFKSVPEHGDVFSSIPQAIEYEVMYSEYLKALRKRLREEKKLIKKYLAVADDEAGSGPAWGPSGPSVQIQVLKVIGSGDDVKAKVLVNGSIKWVGRGEYLAPKVTVASISPRGIEYIDHGRKFHASMLPVSDYRAIQAANKINESQRQFDQDEEDEGSNVATPLRPGMPALFPPVIGR